MNCLDVRGKLNIMSMTISVLEPSKLKIPAKKFKYCSGLVCNIALSDMFIRKLDIYQLTIIAIRYNKVSRTVTLKVLASL